MPHTVLSHTADTGIEATAPSLPELFEELAAAMFGLFAQITSCDPGREATLVVTSETLDELVVDVLSELLYRSEADGTVFCAFEVTAADRHHVRMTARGIESAAVSLIGPPIKAVTYHDLEVAQANRGWRARVYFDV